ncbi:hypothetical protein [Xylocopilactobacillus apis]|uniref:Uncharacterized protein n=1 Tax=Xylocopilactobacillus apis TaxID=2932183 RepID=A0AAU9DKS4_9LACO|nr:hypothetical protein [Xylocopilactobacillus apis]BDR57447.1 hypothetical protein KIMC2_20090 [Xylocopilactobacillus apis]
MDLLYLSRAQLISDLIEAEKLIYRIINLPKMTQSILSICIFPILSLICVGVDDLFSEKDLKLSKDLGLNDQIDFTKLLAKSRSSLKLYTDSKGGKAIKKVEKQQKKFYKELQKGYSDLQKSYISLFGQEDLGVYYYKGLPLANTNQTTIYFDAFDSEIKKENSIERVIEQFSKNQSYYINLVVREFEDSRIEKFEYEKCESKILDSEISNQDFFFLDEDRRNIFTNSDDKFFSLFLFNLKCQLSFSLNVIPLIISENSSLRYRLEMLVYYQAMKKLEFIEKENPFMGIEFVSDLLEKFECIFSNNNLRNNIYHYNLSKDNDQMEIKEDIFISMVEFQTGIKFKDVFDSIERDTAKLIKILEKETCLI